MTSAANNRTRTAKSRGAPFKPGVSGNPSGRPKGVPNKSTTDARAAIALLVEGNIGKLQQWLDAVAKKNPEKAFNLCTSVIEYHIPKHSRVEVAAKDNESESGLSNNELRQLRDLLIELKGWIDSGIIGADLLQRMIEYRPVEKDALSLNE